MNRHYRSGVCILISQIGGLWVKSDAIELDIFLWEFWIVVVYASDLLIYNVRISNLFQSSFNRGVYVVNPTRLELQYLINELMS